MNVGGYGSVGVDQIVGAYPGHVSGPLPGVVGGSYPSIVGQQGPIIGWDAVVGQAAQAAASMVAAQMEQARQIDPNAVMVTPRVRDQRRRLIMGNSPVTLAPGVVTEVEFRPQQLLRVERIIIPSEIAPDVFVNDIKVGNLSQLLTTGGLPGSAFSEVAIDAYLHFDSAEIGNTISLILTNTSAVALSFRSMILGAVAK